MGAERNEKEHQQEVTQTRQPRSDGFPERRRGQRYPRDQTAKLLAEAKILAKGRKGRRQPQREDDQQFRRLGHAAEDGVRDAADDKPEQNQRHGAGRKRQCSVDKSGLLSGARSQRRHDRHREHDRKVLYDQETERNPAVKGVEFAFVRQQLDDDDGAGKCEGDSHIKACNRRHAEADADQKPDDRREENLSNAGVQCDHAERPHQVEIELQANEEQEQRHAELRKQLQIVGRLDDVKTGGACQHANNDEADDHRLAQPDAQQADQRSQHQEGRYFIKNGRFRHRPLPVASPAVSVYSARRSNVRKGPAGFLPQGLSLSALKPV